MRRLLRFVDRAILRLVDLGFLLSAAAMLAIMVIGSIDVIGSMLSFPLPAATEAQEVLLAISIFMAVGYAQHAQQNICVDIVVNFFPLKVRRVLLSFFLAMGALILAVLGARTWTLAIGSWEVGEAANAIITFPIYPAKFLVSVGSWIAAFEFTRQFVWSLLKGDVSVVRPQV